MTPISGIAVAKLYPDEDRADKNSNEEFSLFLCFKVIIMG